MTISLDNISIGYGNIVVADGINAKLNSGQLTCLLGANGAGKSTLLRTLSAFQPALAGSITYDGRELNDFTPQERARLIGVVQLRLCTIQRHRNMQIAISLHSYTQSLCFSVFYFSFHFKGV